jgi:hypothetical protein
MHPLTDNDIESEISYAYLHAVTSHAGAACVPAPRALDANGIDAMITAWGPFPGGGYLEEVALNVQLKATKVAPAIRNGFISYFVKGIPRYDDLRKPTVSVQRILVVMFLPEDSSEWLAIDEEKLLLKRCAYWVCLRGAAVADTATGSTVYIPKTHVFDPTNLGTIFAAISRNERLTYSLP